MSEPDELAERAAVLVETLPRNVVRGIVTRLRAMARITPIGPLISVLSQVLAPEQRGQIESLVDACTSEGLDADVHSLAIAIDSASAATQRCREKQAVEVAWSGPVPAHSTLRRTEQALLATISKAQREVWLLSFVAYRVETLREALVAALRRGVAMNLLLETAESSDGGISRDGVRSLLEVVKAGARVYEWPLHNRPLGPGGKPGLLHVKACVVDGAAAFISSANMTRRAFECNMELGVLIAGGDQPMRILEQVEWLKQAGHIVPLRVEYE